ARVDHGLQRMVHYLAESEESSGHGCGNPGSESGCGPVGWIGFPHQYDVVGPHAVLYGGAAKRGFVISFPHPGRLELQFRSDGHWPVVPISISPTENSHGTQTARIAICAGRA